MHVSDTLIKMHLQNKTTVLLGIFFDRIRTERSSHDELLVCAHTKRFMSFTGSQLPFIFNVRSWQRTSCASAAVSSTMAATWATAAVTLQISNGNTEAATSCRLECHCLPTARKVSSNEHKFFLILHNWRETNNCGLRFPGAVWCVSVLSTMR